MVYEIKFALLPDDTGAIPFLTYEDYLDRLLGQHMWFAPRADNISGGDAIQVLCPAVALTTLKWSDIVDGRFRIVSEKKLTADELASLRGRFGGTLPWEALA